MTTPIEHALTKLNHGLTRADDHGVSVRRRDGSRLTLSQNITLNGQGKNATLDGNHQGTVLSIIGGTTTVQGLTITDGQTAGAGGGIYVASADVLVNVLVTGNSAGTNFGGGIEADFGSSLTLISSTVSGNSADSSGGIDMFEATASLINSTVTGNSVSGSNGCQFVTGGPIFSCAGGIWNYHGTLALTNSTVSSNTGAYRGGGIRDDASIVGGVATDGTTILSGKTKINSNTASNQGGGIWAKVTGGVVAADGAATYKDPVTGATLPAWTGSVSGNQPDQCSPTVTIGGTICGA